MLYREAGRRIPPQGVVRVPGEPTILFVTVCAARPANWLATTAVHESLVSLWKSADAWVVGYYLLMPDHIHLFCAPRDPRFTVDRWIAYWKSQFSRRHMNPDWVWQRSAFHRRLRTPEEYLQKLAYVRENPFRRKLVSAPDEPWAYSGVLHDLRW